VEGGGAAGDESFFSRSPTNPTLDILDIEAIAKSRRPPARGSW